MNRIQTQWALAWNIAINYMTFWRDNLIARSHEFPATRLDGDIFAMRELFYAQGYQKMNRN